MCNMPKYQKTEARTGIWERERQEILYFSLLGAGGGYNERDNVEYNERHDESDSEYDEVKIERNLMVSFSDGIFKFD